MEVDRRCGELVPRGSPTGNPIPFTSNRGGDHDICTMRPDGSDVVRLTNTTGNDARAAWSPDGQCIALTSAKRTKDPSARPQLEGVGWSAVSGRGPLRLRPGASVAANALHSINSTVTLPGALASGVSHVTTFAPSASARTTYMASYAVTFSRSFHARVRRSRWA